MDTSHLTALHNQLVRAKDRLAKEKAEAGRQLRRVWIAQIEKEIENEYKFLGVQSSSALPEMSDDDLMNELMK